MPVWACDLRRARFLRRFLASLFVVEIRVLCVENMPASTLLTQNLHFEPYILIVVVHVCCLALCAPMINSRPTCRFLNQGRGWAVREFWFSFLAHAAVNEFWYSLLAPTAPEVVLRIGAICTETEKGTVHCEEGNRLENENTDSCLYSLLNRISRNWFP